MAETIISQGEYEQGKNSCAPPEIVQAGWYFAERSRLVPGSADEFAREVLIRILDVRGEDGFPIIGLERLEDDGRPVDVGEIVLDPEGIIISDDWTEGGYLIGGRGPGGGPFNITKAELDLYAPAVLRRSVEAPLQVMHIPLPE